MWYLMLCVIEFVTIICGFLYYGMRSLFLGVKNKKSY